MTCMLDDNPAFARLTRADGSKGYLCLLHYLTYRVDPEFFRDSEGNVLVKKLQPIKGNIEPPMTDPKRPHKWVRKTLVGIFYDWECEVCRLWIKERHCMHGPPDEYGYGGCLKEEKR